MAWRKVATGSGLWAGLSILGCTSVLGDFKVGDAGLSDASVDGGSGKDSATDATKHDSGDASHDATRPKHAPDDQMESTDATEDAIASDDASDDATEGGCASGLVCSGNCIEDTDKNNCGACGHSCLGGTCTGGVCKPFTVYNTASTDPIVDFDTDGTAVVWADSFDSTINYVAGTAESPVVIASYTTTTGSVSSPVNVALAGTLADWTQGSGGTSGNAFTGYAKAGVANSGMLDPSSLSGAPQGLVFNGAGDYIYFLLSGTSYLTLIRVPPDDSNELFFTYQVMSTQGSASLAVDSAGKYAVFGDIQHGEVLVYPLNGDTATGPSGYPDSNWVATDGTNAYWSSTVAGKYPILSAPLASPTTVTTLLANAAGLCTGMATDGVNVYFIANSVVYYVPVAGGRPARVLASIAGTEHLKFRGSGVFFDDGTKVWEVATP